MTKATCAGTSTRTEIYWHLLHVDYFSGEMSFLYAPTEHDFWAKLKTYSSADCLAQRNLVEQL